MAYRSDKNLEFLGNLPSEDLNELVYCLTHDTDGEIRFSEELTGASKYKRYYPDHHQYWELIAAEIQCFGANTFVTFFRGGEGVLYREILTDVCDELKVPYNKNSNIERIEDCLLMKILEKALEEMSSSEIKELANSLGIENTAGFTGPTAIATFQTIFKMGGFKSYKITLIIANAVFKQLFGKGLTFAANATLTRTVAVLTGPIGWAITGLWTAIDIAGPAYRVTIPAVIQVAYLRKKYQSVIGQKFIEQINF